MPNPTTLPFSGDPEADALIASDPLALLIGFLLDQQITVQQAFRGPLELRRRVATLDARELARMDAGRLEEAFRGPPALHRFPGSMAQRTQALCAAIAAEHDGDAAAVWEGAASGADLEARLRALPGIGDMKARTIIGILVRRYGIQPPGWEEVMPHGPTLADVDSPEALAAYQSDKRARKAAARAAAAAGPGST